MRTESKPQLSNLRRFIGKLDSGRSDIATRYKEVLREEAVPAKHRKLAKPQKE